MEKEIPLILIIGIISISLLIWSSHRIDVSTFELLRTNLFTPAKVYQQPSKILCWVLTVDLPENYLKRRAVEETWGKRCDKLLIVTNGSESSQTKNNTLAELKATEDNVIRVPLKRDGRDQLWHKVVTAFSYIHDNHLNEYDWFMKADDDTYVLVDNLKRYLRKEEPEDPIYFGCRFRPYVKQGYMSGGAGYVLSRKALRLLVEEGFHKRLDRCHLERGKVEDVEIGLCLQAVGVRAGDTRDSEGKPTFLPLSPVDLVATFQRDRSFWYYNYDFYGAPGIGEECCSNKPISFHYIDPRMMYFIEYIHYHVER